MSERFNGGPRETSEPAETIEFKNARDHLDLRILFAEAVSEKVGIPLSEALRDYTDLYRRLTGTSLGDSRTDANVTERWEKIAAEISSAPSHDERAQIALNYYKDSGDRNIDHESDPYWPFRYDYDSEHKIVKLHFGSMSFKPRNEEGPGILSDERLEEQRAKLRDMFTEIKRLHPDAREVHGASWLYNREDYRRLFPRKYTDVVEVRKDGFSGGATWGQFVDKNGGVKADLRAQFKENLTHLNPDKLKSVFRYQTLVVSAPIEAFHAEYGIK